MIATISKGDVHTRMVNVLLTLQLIASLLGREDIICIMVSHPDEELTVLVTTLVFHCNGLVRVTTCITLGHFRMPIAKWLECWRHAKLVILPGFPSWDYPMGRSISSLNRICRASLGHSMDLLPQLKERHVWVKVSPRRLLRPHAQLFRMLLH